jgi:hypothetical protein
MAHMNCSRFPAGPQPFEAVVARHALRALKTLEALRRSADAGSSFDDESLGPGWFDSSWELGQGLDVREGLPADAGLDEWLAVCLAA